jgi:hypothetical protein
MNKEREEGRRMMKGMYKDPKANFPSICQYGPLIDPYKIIHFISRGNFCLFLHVLYQSYKRTIYHTRNNGGRKRRTLELTPHPQ